MTQTGSSPNPALAEAFIAKCDRSMQETMTCLSLDALAAGAENDLALAVCLGALRGTLEVLKAFTAPEAHPTVELLVVSDVKRIFGSAESMVDENDKPITPEMVTARIDAALRRGQQQQPDAAPQPSRGPAPPPPVTPTTHCEGASA